jgi:hypothetical protein
MIEGFHFDLVIELLQTFPSIGITGAGSALGAL